MRMGEGELPARAMGRGGGDECRRYEAAEEEEADGEAIGSARKAGDQCELGPEPLGRRRLGIPTVLMVYWLDLVENLVAVAKIWSSHSSLQCCNFQAAQCCNFQVRGFTFDINSGAMESLELDSFGFSIVPSSLVSTYCLFVEDVLDILSDTIVVHEDAVSRVQQLTQGILGTQNIHGPGGGEIDGYSRSGRRKANSEGG